MANKVRSFNPVWNLRDLTSLPLDDTYYVFFLENQIPYVPVNVFEDPSGNVILSNPVQVSAAGTIGPNLFFTPHQVLRIEIRRGDTQNDELVWLIENYVPDGGDGPGPEPGTSIETDNQITNPQFSIVEFSSPYTQTGISNQAVEIAPGWIIQVNGTGNLTVEQIELTSDDAVPTNAPYGVLISTSGFTSAFLIQQFDENGTIWSSKAVASSITARTVDGSPHTLNVSLTNNASTPLSLPIDSHTLTIAWQEFRGAVDVPASTNNTASSSAWTRFNVSLPGTGQIAITSLQLMGQSTPVEVPYEQESVARQQDHLFHYYRESLILQPKESVLTGFNFSLNPWQAHATTSATLTAQTAYTADQTIIHQQTGGSKVSVGRGGAGDNFPLQVTAVTSDNRFAAIEYIDPSTIRPYWGGKLSALLRARIATTHGSQVRVKMRLIYRSALPNTISATDPISSWTGSADPSFNPSAWAGLAPKNDPAYTLTTSYEYFAFEGFQLPISSSANMTLGVLIYTVDNMNQTGTPDAIQLERCSLVPNEFAIDANVLTFDENLRRCRFYYEKSYPLDSIPGAATTFNNNLTYKMDMQDRGGTLHLESLRLDSFNLPYAQKRDNPTLVFYSPTATTAGVALLGIYRSNTAAPFVGGPVGSNPGLVTMTTSFVENGKSTSRVEMRCLDTSTAQIVSNENFGDEGILSLHFVANSRLGR